MRAGWVLWCVLAAPAAAQDPGEPAPPPPQEPSGKAPAAEGAPEPEAPVDVGLALRVAGQATDAWFRVGVPTPLCVDVAVPPAAPEGGEVEVVAHTPIGPRVLWRVAVDAPPGSRRRYRGLGLRTPDNATALEARWFRADTILAKARVDVRRAPLDMAWVWVLANESLPGAWDGIIGSLRPTMPPGLEEWERPEWRPAWHCTRIESDALPVSWLSFVAADAVVLAPPLQAPSVELTLAFAQWVELGGRALVGGGLEGAKLAPGFNAVLPVTPGPAQAADLRPLVDILRPRARVTGPFTGQITLATVRSGRRYAATADGAPLMLVHEPGLGRVCWLACALDDREVRPLACTEPALRLLLRSRRRSTIARARLAWDPPPPPTLPSDEELRLAGETPVPRWHDGVLRTVAPEVLLPPPAPDGMPVASNARAVLFEQLAVSIPTRRQLGWWLVLYVLGAAFLVWAGHRWKRVGRAWLAVGLLGVVAFGLVTGVAAATYDTVTAGRAFVVAEGALGGRRVALAGTAALYTPTGGPTVLSLPSPVERAVLAERRLAGVPQRRAEGAAIAFDAYPRALEPIDVAGTLDLGGAVSATVLPTGRIRVHNTTRWTLRSIWIARGSAWARVGELAPGAMREVTPGIDRSAEFADRELADLWRRRALRSAGGDRLVCTAGLDLDLSAARLGDAVVEGAPQVALVLHGPAVRTTGVEAPSIQVRVASARFTDASRARRAQFVSLHQSAGRADVGLPARLHVADMDDAPWWGGPSERVLVRMVCPLESPPAPSTRFRLPVRPVVEWLDRGRAAKGSPPVRARVVDWSALRVPSGTNAQFGREPRWLLGTTDGAFENVARFVTPAQELRLTVHLELSHSDWSPAPDAVEPDPNRRLAIWLAVDPPEVRSMERPR